MKQKEGFIVPLEKQEQIKVVAYCQRKGIPIYSVPNGGSRNLLEAINLKRQGCAPGVPDIVIPRARGPYHSLYIELKRQKGGRVSDSQRYWLDLLTHEGMLAVVANGGDEAIKHIEDYLALPKQDRAS